MNSQQSTSIGIPISVSSGSTTLVAAVAGFKIVVMHYAAIGTATETITFKSNATALTGAMPFVANGGIFAAFEKGLFETAAGEPLVITVSAGTAVGHLSYELQK